MEKKVNLIMKYLIARDVDEVAKLKKDIIKALNEESAPTSKMVLVENVIRDILKEIGTPPHILGHEYVVTSAKLAYADRTLLQAITKRLYPEAAKMHNTTASRLERAMRHAVECSFDRGDFDRIMSVFGNTFSTQRGKLTNSEFLAGLVNEVDRRMRDYGEVV
jgi:two-component system response regulator (stage 0 sporulation protein A)